MIRYDESTPVLALQHLFALPAYCSRRLDEARARSGVPAGDSATLACVPYPVPEDMRNERVAAVLLLTARGLWFVGERGFVCGGELWLRTETGGWERHSNGYDAFDRKNPTYLLHMVGPLVAVPTDWPADRAAA